MELEPTELKPRARFTSAVFQQEFVLYRMSLCSTDKKQGHVNVLTDGHDTFRAVLDVKPNHGKTQSEGVVDMMFLWLDVNAADESKFKMQL